jgi:hypothetical protein
MQTNCVNAGKSASFCQCSTDELTRRFPLIELREISAAKRFDELPGDLGQRASGASKAIDQGC